MTASVKCGAYGGIGTLSYSFYKGDSPQNNMMSLVSEPSIISVVVSVHEKLTVCDVTNLPYIIWI